MGFADAARQLLGGLDLSAKSKKPPEDPEGATRRASDAPPLFPQTGKVFNQFQEGISNAVDATPRVSAAQQIRNQGNASEVVGSHPGAGFIGSIDPGMPVDNMSFAPPPPGPGGPAILGADPTALPPIPLGGAGLIPQIDANQQYSQQNQDQIIDLFTEAALGSGPTQASALAQQTGDRMLRQMQQQGAMGGALGTSQAQMAAPMLMGELTQNASMLAAQEQNQARELLQKTIVEEQDAALRWGELTSGLVQQNAELANLVTEQFAKGFVDAAGNAVTQAELTLAIQKIIQERGRFLAGQELTAALASGGLTIQEPTPGVLAQTAPAFEGIANVAIAANS